MSDTPPLRAETMTEKQRAEDRDFYELALRLGGEDNPQCDRFCRWYAESQALSSRLSAVEAKQQHDEQKWRDYETHYILPCFKWAKDSGIDLEALVRDNVGKNCVELLVAALQRENADLREDRERLDWLEKKRKFGELDSIQFGPDAVVVYNEEDFDIGAAKTVREALDAAKEGPSDE